MKRCIFTVLLLLAFKPALPVNPGDEGARIVHEKLYYRAVQNLTGGDGESKAEAALFFGSRRNPRYIRILGRELLKDLDVKSTYRVFPVNDPFVKSNIAWALGEIRHQKALPYLIQALAKTSEFIDEEAKRIEARQKREIERTAEEEKGNAKDDYLKFSINKGRVMLIVEPRDRPGPLLYKNTHALPYSPDVYWSISDEFKEFLVPNQGDQAQRIRMYGFNYVNLAFHIFDAVGKIYHFELDKTRVKDSDVEAVSAYLKHGYGFIRGAAAVCLGMIGSAKALGALEARFADETDPEVLARISHAMMRNDKGQTKHYVNLLKLLEHDERNVRFAAAIGLRELHLGESLVALKEAFRLEDDDVIRQILNEAIDAAYLDSLRPVPH